MFECGTHNKVGRKSSQKRVHKVMSGTDEKEKHKEMNRTDGVLFILALLILGRHSVLVRARAKSEKP